LPSEGPVVEPSRADDSLHPFAPSGAADVPAPRTEPSPAVEQPAVPQPRFRPVAAKPSGNPSAWVTNDDYPDSALRNEEQGRTAFRLAIGADGRPTSCTVTASSGARALDDAACRLLMRRARFTAAKDADGAAVAGTYANSFLWQIPAD
jgi:protein TonB